jgi:hypothetical protein
MNPIAMRQCGRSILGRALRGPAPMVAALVLMLSVLTGGFNVDLGTASTRAVAANAGPGALPAWLEKRLAALSAKDAEGYLLLAEEVADAAQSPEQLKLARQLYTLALSLDATAQQQTGNATGTGTSACYGLAELTRSRTERRWLVAIGESLRPRSDRVRAAPLTDQPSSWTTAINLVDAISLARAGEGRRADALLKRPGVEELLTRYERALDDRGYFNSAGRLRRWITDWPTCPECNNRRVVNRPEGGKTVLRPCGTCKGNPGPAFELDELVNQVRFQSSLLSGISASWAAALLTDGGEPIREPEAGEVAALYGVDPAATSWQDGRWVKP